MRAQVEDDRNAGRRGISKAASGSEDELQRGEGNKIMDEQSTVGSKSGDGQSTVGSKSGDGQSTAGSKSGDGQSTAGSKSGDGQSTAGSKSGDGRNIYYLHTCHQRTHESVDQFFIRCKVRTSS